MVDADRFVSYAESSYYDGKRYSDMDCQGYVESVLNKTDSTARYNWRGSNHMWRDALYWKGTIEECRKLYGCVPAGAWMFIIKNDGGEKARGYNDTQGNASHVGIMCSGGQIRHSTKTKNVDGVTYAATNWTHVGLAKAIDYHLEPYRPTVAADPVEEQLVKSIQLAQQALADYLYYKEMKK